MWRGSPRRCMSCSQSQSRATDDRWRYVYYWLIGPDDQTKVIMHSLLNQARVWNLGIGFDGSGNRNYQNFENSANFGIFWSKLFENLTDFEWIRIIFDKFKKNKKTENFRRDVSLPVEAELLKFQKFRTKMSNPESGHTVVYLPAIFFSISVLSYCQNWGSYDFRYMILHPTFHKSIKHLIHC